MGRKKALAWCRGVVRRPVLRNYTPGWFLLHGPVLLVVPTAACVARSFSNRFGILEIALVLRGPLDKPLSRHAALANLRINVGKAADQGPGYVE